MKRVMSVWFPRWPLQRLCLVRPELKDRPIVLYGSGRRGGWQVRHCSRAAVAHGVAPGMSLAEAQALLEKTNPCCEPHDAAADRQFLESLAAWCQRYSPLVGLEEQDSPETLLLDITGCAPLFGGEQSLGDQVIHDFRQAGFFVRVAIADTIGAAWALAHFPPPAPTVRQQPVGQGPRALVLPPLAPAPIAEKPEVPRAVPAHNPGGVLASLPASALRLPVPVLDLLRELDLGTIGRLRALPRATLPSRFGASILQRLDQMTGTLIELIVPVMPPEPLVGVFPLESPTSDRQVIERSCRALLEPLLEKLAGRQEGLVRLACRLLGTEGPPVCLTIGVVRPRCALDGLMELVRLALERTQLASEVRQVEIEGLATGRLGCSQGALFFSARRQNSQRHLAVLIDRLNQRLGPGCVLRPELVPDVQPECAARFLPCDREPFRREKSARRPAPWEEHLPGGTAATHTDSAAPLPDRGIAPRTSDPAFGGPQVLCFAPFPPTEATPRNGSRENSGSRSAPRDGSLPRRHEAPVPPAFSEIGMARVSGGGTRPLALKSPPQPVEVMSVVPDGPPLRFRWEQVEHTVCRSFGPERLETGWWRGAHVRRDYYRVETTTGRRFWVFRETATGQWFLHGVFE